MRALAIALFLALASGHVSAGANTFTRLMADAIAEAAGIVDLATRARTVIAIAHVQNDIGLTEHARDALRQTAETLWRTPNAMAGALLAEVVEAQCALELRADAARVLKVAADVADTPQLRVRLLRSALFCADRSGAAALEAAIDRGPDPATAIALARLGLPVRAESIWRRLPAAERDRTAPAVAAALAAIGHVGGARAIEPGVGQADPAAAIPVLLAEATLRRQAGEFADARAFLAIAAGHVMAAPHFAPTVAEAYANANGIAEAMALAPLVNGANAADNAPDARAAIAAALARAGNLEEARIWSEGTTGAAAARAFSAIARASRDPEAAAAAARHARNAIAGSARARALADAAAANFAIGKE